ncbi:hypothetical protein Ae168Ps1_1660 [Pseudonocardia sp. Ae168_Ps1]|nr:hypothetical protein Ae168Ps1_1660 [Pseudonocardia sp. Ae168_Ps1]
MPHRVRRLSGPLRTRTPYPHRPRRTAPVRGRAAVARRAPERP